MYCRRKVGTQKSPSSLSLHPASVRPHRRAAVSMKSLIPFIGCVEFIGVYSCETPAKIGMRENVSPKREAINPPHGSIIHPCGMSGGRMRYAPTRVPGQLRCPRRGRPYTGTIIHPCGMSGGGECNSPLHEVPGQTSLPRQGPSADAPSIRSGDKKCRTGFTAGPAPMKKVIDMNTPPKKEEILLCISFMPCSRPATPGGSPR